MNTPTNQPNRPRIFEHMTKSRFLHVEDSLEIGKLRLFIGSYEKGKGAQSTAYAFIDVDDARVILSDLSWRKSIDFTDFKGGRNSAGKIISRVLKIKSKEDKIWLEIQNGEGELIGEGAVKPKGKPESEVSLALTTYEAHKLAHACLAYMQAWQVKQMITGLISRAIAPAEEEND